MDKDLKQKKLTKEESSKITYVSQLVYDILEEQLQGGSLQDVLNVCCAVIVQFSFALDYCQIDDVSEVVSRNIKTMHSDILKQRFQNLN